MSTLETPHKSRIRQWGSLPACGFRVSHTANRKLEADATTFVGRGRGVHPPSGAGLILLPSLTDLKEPPAM